MCVQALYDKERLGSRGIHRSADCAHASVPVCENPGETVAIDPGSARLDRPEMNHRQSRLAALPNDKRSVPYSLTANRTPRANRMKPIVPTHIVVTANERSLRVPFLNARVWQEATFTVNRREVFTMPLGTPFQDRRRDR